MTKTTKHQIASCTILIPTKDRPNLLKRATMSALEAAPDDGQVLVVDDQSVVPATHVLKQIKDRRLRVIRIENNIGGAAGARNAGIKFSTGTVIFLLDDDDEISSGYCARILERAVEKGGADYGFSNVILQNSKRSPNRPRRPAFPTGILPNNAPFKERSAGFGCGFWLKRSTFDEIGKFNEALVTNEDTEYFCRLIFAGKKAWYCAEPAIRIHSHTENGTDLTHLTHRTSPAVRARCFVEIIEGQRAFIKSDRTARCHLLKRGAALLIKSGQVTKARELSAVHHNSLDRGLFQLYCTLRTMF